MPIPLLALAAGVAARGAATRMGATGGQRLAAGAATQFGVGALQRQHQNRAAGQQQRRQTGWNTGVTQWARENPGEALASGTLAMARGTTLGDSALNQTTALLQSTQFAPKA